MESILVYYLGIGAIILVMAVRDDPGRVFDSIPDFLTSLVFLWLWPAIVIHAFVLAVKKAKELY